MNGTSASAASVEMTRQDSSDKVYCVCRKRESDDDDEVTMIQCESYVASSPSSLLTYITATACTDTRRRCLEWYHASCVGLSDDQVDNVDVYICRSCERSELHRGWAVSDVSNSDGSGTRQKTIYKELCKRDGCDKGLKGRDPKSK